MNPYLRKEFQAAHITLPEAIRALKREWLENALLNNHGNFCRTARSLGTHRNTLSRTVRELGIDVSVIRHATR